MANVGFKRGSASALASLIAANANTPQFVEGTFYLTNDTNKLYFAQANNKLVDLNQYIQIWNKSALPTIADAPNIAPGDIYYWEPQNILAIVKSVSGGSVSWTQLNPDTHVTATSQAVTLTTPSTGTVQITTNVIDSGNNLATGNFQLIQGSNVTLTTDTTNRTVTIAATQSSDHTYTLTSTANSSNAAKLNLHDVLGNTNDTVTFIGSGIASASSDASKNITINVPTRPVNSVAATFTSAGVLTINAGTADGSASGTVTPIVTYGQAATPEQAKFESGTAYLDVYTADEVDNKLQDLLGAADAMVYKGTVSSSDAATKLGRAGSAANTYAGNVGDTYKASTTITSPVAAKTGDLIIAEGTDGAVTWSVVPSGDDQTITGTVNGNSMAVSDASGIIAGITLAESSDATKAKIVLSNSQSGNVNTITLSHGTAGTAQTKLGSVTGGTAYTAVASGTTQAGATSSSNASTKDIPTITGLSYDGAGHIVSVDTATYRVIDSHANLSTFDLSITGDAASNSNTTTNKAIVSLSVSDTDGASAINRLGFCTSTNSSIQITQTTATINSNSVPTVQIDMVWGSF